MNIVKETHLRYLERHQQQMKRSIGKFGYEGIKTWDLAARRGRPVVDAFFCLTGLTTDRAV